MRLPVHWLLLAPVLLFVGAMAMFPLGYSLVLSFREWKLARSPMAGDFVGLSNYINLLTDDPDFLEALRVTGIFVTADVLVTVAVSLVCALLLHRAGRLNSLARTLLILPFVMSPALIGISLLFFECRVWGRCTCGRPVGAAPEGHCLACRCFTVDGCDCRFRCLALGTLHDLGYVGRFGLDSC